MTGSISSTLSTSIRPDSNGINRTRMLSDLNRANSAAVAPSMLAIRTPSTANRGDGRTASDRSPSIAISRPVSALIRSRISGL